VELLQPAIARWKILCKKDVCEKFAVIQIEVQTDQIV